MTNKLKLAIPKGRMYDEVVAVLRECGIKLSPNGRNYRPLVNDLEIEAKILKPQNIPKLVQLGSQDIAFTGYDWVVEQDAKVEELLDLGLDPVKVVAAMPKETDANKIKSQNIRVASEYENITRKFLEKKGINYVFIKSYGASEVFVPEDADMIVDNMSSGQTLRENNLEIFSEILSSSTRLIANKQSLQDPWKKRKISDLVMVIQSVLEGRKKLLVEMNVPEEKLQQLIPVLPCMKAPTISKLYGGQGYAIKVAVDKECIRELIPILKKNGAIDILVFGLQKVVL